MVTHPIHAVQALSHVAVTHVFLQKHSAPPTIFSFSVFDKAKFFTILLKSSLLFIFSLIFTFNNSPISVRGAFREGSSVAYFCYFCRCFVLQGCCNGQSLKLNRVLCSFNALRCFPAGSASLGYHACFRQPCSRTVSPVPATGARLAGTLYNPQHSDVKNNETSVFHSIPHY